MSTATDHIPLTAVGERRVESIDWLMGLLPEIATHISPVVAQTTLGHIKRLAGPVEIPTEILDRLAGPIGGRG